MPRRGIAVIDAETDPFLHGRIPAPFIWGFYDGETYLEFSDVDELMEFLATQRIIVYAHNGGRFDYHFVLDYIEYGTDITVINGRIAKFKIGECEFRDSWNLLPVPLGQLQKDEIDYRIMEREERDKPANKAEISNYLRGDCVYLWEWVTAFVEQYGMKLTVASTAMHYWSKLTGTKPPRDNGELYEELKRYYHGGRTQSFAHGVIEKEFQLVDINSAYPYAMLSEHPIGLSRFMGEGKTEWLSLPKKQRETSLLTVVGVANGCFPWRAGAGLFYPDDNEPRTYHVTGWEYMAALDTGTFDGKVGEFYYFDVLTDFSEYVLHFYRMKQTAGKGSHEYQFAKLLMNSLYGKFAANPDDYRDFQAGWPGMLDDSGDCGEWSFNCAINEDLIIVSRPQPEEQKKFFNLATAASITGFVRAYMWRSICRCSGVLYCDTDSIAAVDVSGLGLGAKLGEWDLEGTFDYGAFAGRKLYAMHAKGRPRAFSFDDKTTFKNWKVASKGVKLAPKNIINIANGKTETYRPMAPTFSLHKGPHFISRRVKMTRKVAPKPSELAG